MKVGNVAGSCSLRFRKPQEKRKEGSMAEEKVGTGLLGLFLLYLYFCLQCKKSRRQAIWKWRQVNFACVFVTFLFIEKVTGLLALISLPCRFLFTWSEKRQKKVKGKVRGEKEDLVPFGKNQKRQEQKKAAEIRIEESMDMILSYFFIFFLQFQCE